MDKVVKFTNKKQSLLLMLLLSCTTLVYGQNGGDFFSNIGKIYVVVGVIVLIFLGLVFFLYRIERRIERLEKDLTKS